MIDWKKKLSSRKFWIAVAAFITAVFTAFGVDETTTAHVATCISAWATVVIYILSESAVDAANKR